MKLSALEQALSASRSEKWNYTSKIGEVFKGRPYDALSHSGHTALTFKFKGYFAVVYNADLAEENTSFAKFLDELYMDLTKQDCMVITCPIEKSDKESDKEPLQEFIKFMTNNKNNNLYN